MEFMGHNWKRRLKFISSIKLLDKLFLLPSLLFSFLSSPFPPSLTFCSKLPHKLPCPKFCNEPCLCERREGWGDYRQKHNENPCSIHWWTCCLLDPPWSPTKEYSFRTKCLKSWYVFLNRKPVVGFFFFSNGNIILTTIKPHKNCYQQAYGMGLRYASSILGAGQKRIALP